MTKHTSKVTSGPPKLSQVVDPCSKPHGQLHPNLTTISVEPKILAEFVPLKLKTCSLYHENLLLQKFNDMYTRGSYIIFFSL